MNFIKKLFSNIKANWKNIIGIISAICTAIIPFFQNLMDFGIGVQVCGLNIIPFILICLTSAVAVIGCIVDGVHGIKVWQVLIDAKKQIKAELKSQKSEKIIDIETPKTNEMPETAETVESDEIAKFINSIKQ